MLEDIPLPVSLRFGLYIRQMPSKALQPHLLLSGFRVFWIM